MCLIVFAHQLEPGLPLVVAANRDEFFRRPTAEAEFWSAADSGRSLLAGRDLQAGGSWLGVDRAGRFAAVTNIRDPSLQTIRPLSRGQLITDYLCQDLEPADYCAALLDNIDQFAAFNLLLGDGRSMVFLHSMESTYQVLPPGLYGLSNGHLNSPWPKIERSRERLSKLLAAPGRLSTDALIAMMADSQPAPDAELPDTGIGLALERELSPVFIAHSARQYGTRCSTAVILDGEGEMRFCEQSYTADGQPGASRYFQFPLVPGAANQQ